MKYIVNGRIVMPDRVITGKALAYDEKISGVVKTEDIPAGAEVIDAKGNYVCPGLVDIHIHGYLNEDTSDGKPEGIRKMAYGVAENGVTSFLPTTMTVSEEEIVAGIFLCQIQQKFIEGEEITAAQLQIRGPAGRPHHPEASFGKIPGGLRLLLCGTDRLYTGNAIVEAVL